jgi:hypothetical protein
VFCLGNAGLEAVFKSRVSIAVYTIPNDDSAKILIMGSAGRYISSVVHYASSASHYVSSADHYVSSASRYVTSADHYVSLPVHYASSPDPS